jgi:hypothetical protein
MKKLGRYIGQRLKIPLPHEKILVLGLLKLIQGMYRERENNLEQLRAIKRRVFSWTLGRVKREGQSLWDSRIKEAIQELERNRRAVIGNLPQVLELAILRLAGEVCGEVVQRPDWLHREIQRLLEYLKDEFPYLNRDDRVPLVIAISKGSSLSIAHNLGETSGFLGNVIIVEDGSLKAGDLRVVRDGVGFSTTRSEVISNFKGEESVSSNSSSEDLEGIV